MARACGPSGPQWCAQYAWRLRPAGAWGLAFAVLARLAGQVYFVARAAQYAANDILREAAAGQEARLLGIGRAVGRLFAEALAPDLQRALVLGGPKLIAQFGHLAVVHAMLAQLLHDARRPWRDARRCTRL